MRKLLQTIVYCVQYIYGDIQSETDPTQIPLAKATTPDQIIAAAIVQSFATNYDDWSKSGGFGKPTDRSVTIRSTLTNRNKEIVISHATRDIAEYCMYGGGHYKTYKICNMQVNDVQIDDECMELILKQWDLLTNQLEEAKRVAREAKKVMEQNELKWNVAEKILGMKRNNQGAWVPHTGDNPKQLHAPLKEMMEITLDQ